MALRASPLKGAVVAAICVALVVCWVGEPAEGRRSSCGRVHRCIARCPSKCNKEAARTCESARGADFSKCRNGCGTACNFNCQQSGKTNCDCDNVCDKSCKTMPGPIYNACLSAVFQRCKDSCEKKCKGKKVHN